MKKKRLRFFVYCMCIVAIALVTFLTCANNWIKIYNTRKEINELKEKYESKKNVIRGHIVKYPIHFLKDEQLDIDFFSKENLIPEKNFT